MKRLSFDFSVIELTDEQVQELYTLWREIEDPDYPKEILATKEEVVVFIMTIDTTQYICISDPHSTDKWYMITK